MSVMTWEEVKALPEYKEMSAKEQEEARNEYFNDVIAPLVREEGGDIGAERAAFDADTAPVSAPQVKATPSTFLGRVGQGIGDQAVGAAQLMENLPLVGGGIKAAQKALGAAGNMDDYVAQREQEYAASRDAAGSTGFDAARLLGNMISPLGVAKAAGGVVLQGAKLGGAAALTQPVADSQNYGWNKLRDVLGGTVGGGAMGGIVGQALPMIGRAVPTYKEWKSGFDRENVKKLLSNDVYLTRGQILGGEAKRLEEKMSSNPLLSWKIYKDKERSRESLNRAVAKRALDPVGGTLPKGTSPGRDTVEYVHGKMQDAYDKAIGNTVTRMDDEALAAIDVVKRGLHDPVKKEQLNNYMADKILSRYSKYEVLGKDSSAMTGVGSGKGVGNKEGSTLVDVISGEDMKKIDWDLGSEAHRYMKDVNNSSNYDYGKALSAMQDIFRDLIYRQNPQQAAQLSKANAAYRNYKIMEDASVRAGSTTGVITPSNLNAAVKSANYRSKYATGKGTMQDLSDPAKAVMGDSVGDSGTASRHLSLAMFHPDVFKTAAAATIPYALMGVVAKRAMQTAQSTAPAAPPGMLSRAGSAVGNVMAPPVNYLTQTAAPAVAPYAGMPAGLALNQMLSPSLPMATPFRQAEPPAPALAE